MIVAAGCGRNPHGTGNLRACGKGSARGVFGAGVLGTGMRRMCGIDFFDETEK